MSENTETSQNDPTIMLRCIISPAVLAVLLKLTDEEIAAQFVIVSKQYGVSDSFIRASWRQIAARISRATSRKSSPRKTTPALKGGRKNSQG